MKKRLFIYWIGMCFFLSAAWAVKVTSLYQVEASVDSQSAESRASAVREGFLQILTKLTGDPNVAKNPLIKSSLLKADYYVQEYSYSAPTTNSSQYIISIHFDAADINRLLKKAGVSYWGNNRPLMLAWLVLTDQQNQHQIIGNETPDNILKEMKQQSTKYGLPLIFPMMDVSDLNHISPQDIIDRTHPVLKEASSRYLPDALLIGHIQESAEGYTSQWQLVVNKDQWTWNISDSSINHLITSILNQVSQTLAKHYVMNLPNASTLWLKVEVDNISQRNDFAALMQYLKQLPFVQQIQLSQVSGDTVELAILVQGTSEAFQQNVVVSQHLAFQSQDEKEKKLIYKWVH